MHVCYANAGVCVVSLLMLDSAVGREDCRHTTHAGRSY